MALQYGCLSSKSCSDLDRTRSHSCGNGVHNLRVTGDALRMPYQVHEATYGIAPVLLWQTPLPMPTYHHKVIRDFHTEWSLTYFNTDSLGGRGFVKVKKNEFKHIMGFLRRI